MRHISWKLILLNLLQKNNFENADKFLTPLSCEVWDFSSGVAEDSFFWDMMLHTGNLDPNNVMHCIAPLALHNKWWSQLHGFTCAGGENCSMLPHIVTYLLCTTCCLTFCCPGMTAVSNLKYSCIALCQQCNCTSYTSHCCLIRLLIVPYGPSPVIMSQYYSHFHLYLAFFLEISTLEDDDTVALKHRDKVTQWHSIMSCKNWILRSLSIKFLTWIVCAIRI